MKGKIKSHMPYQMKFYYAEQDEGLMILLRAYIARLFAESIWFLPCFEKGT